jgi:hypothetical protein
VAQLAEKGGIRVIPPAASRRYGYLGRFMNGKIAE